MTSISGPCILVIGSLTVDLEKRQLYTEDNSKAVHVPKSPLRLIKILHEKSGLVISTPDLKQLLWGKHQRGNGALLELVRRTRSLLEELGPGRGDHIVNIKGKGYFLMRWPSAVKQSVHQPRATLAPPLAPLLQKIEERAAA